MVNTWFTADWHIGHYNIIKHCNRPFATPQEMYQTIVENFVSRVKRNDKVYFLGDLAWKSRAFFETLAIMPGRWTFILGNHDEPFRNIAKRFTFVEKVERLLNTKINGYPVTLCHYPLLTWHKSHYNSWNLHGHCHGTLQERHPRRIDVGVDSWGFKPVHFDELKQLVEQRGGAQ